MKTLAIVAVSLALAATVLIIFWPKTGLTPNPRPVLSPMLPQPGPIVWAKGYTAAVAEAKAQHKLVMVDIYTSWCEYCKQLDQNVYTDTNVIRAIQQVVPVKVDGEKEGLDLANKYNIQGYPTILFLNPDGTLVSEIDGYEEPDQFISDLNKAVNMQSNDISKGTINPSRRVQGRVVACYTLPCLQKERAGAG
jgi:thiol:disulfide interchange protein